MSPPYSWRSARVPDLPRFTRPAASAASRGEQGRAGTRPVIALLLTCVHVQVVRHVLAPPHRAKPYDMVAGRQRCQQQIVANRDRRLWLPGDARIKVRRQCWICGNGKERRDDEVVVEVAQLDAVDFGEQVRHELQVW